MRRREREPGLPGVVLTCEHAGRRVPREVAPLFRGAAEVLRTHRGWDIGALAVAERMRDRLGAPLVVTEISRLVVEANRSLDHPALFSGFTRRLDERMKAHLIGAYWEPFRREAGAAVDAAIRRCGSVVHLSVHSFTPEWKGRVREVDIGLLHDPGRAGEAALCRRWRAALNREAPDLRVRLNRPYAGWTDGHCTALRSRLSGRRYLGVEVEVNNGLIRTPAAARRMGDLLVRGLISALGG